MFDILTAQNKNMNALYFAIPLISNFIIFLFEKSINLLVFGTSFVCFIFLFAYFEAYRKVISVHKGRPEKFIKEFSEGIIETTRKEFPHIKLLFVFSVAFFVVYFYTLYEIFTLLGSDLEVYGTLFIVQLGLLFYVNVHGYLIKTITNFFKMKP